MPEFIFRLVASLSLIGAPAPLGAGVGSESHSLNPTLSSDTPALSLYDCKLNSRNGETFVSFTAGAPGPQYFFPLSRVAASVDFRILQDVSDVKLYASYSVTSPGECLLGSLESLNLLVPTLVEDPSDSGQHFAFPVKTPLGKVVGAFVVAKQSSGSLLCAIIGGPGSGPTLNSGGGIHIGSAGDGSAPLIKPANDGSSSDIQPIHGGSLAGNAASGGRCSLSPEAPFSLMGLVMMLTFATTLFIVRRLYRGRSAFRR